MPSCEGCENQVPDGMCDPLFKATNAVREKDALIAYQREQIAKLVARDLTSDAQNIDITRTENQALRGRVAELLEDRNNLRSELADMTKLCGMGDAIIKGYEETLDLIPECSMHGRRCLPHCADWIKVHRPF